MSRRWTDQEVADLRRRYPVDDIKAIAAALGRGVAGVADKARQLGLRKRNTAPWTRAEFAEIERRYPDEPAADIARDLGRSTAMIYARGLLHRGDEGARGAVAAAYERQEVIVPATAVPEHPKEKPAMQLTLEPTDKIVTLVVNDTEVPARIWQGQTSKGVPVHCYITRVAVDKNRPASELAEFERDLHETAAMRPDVDAIPMRLIL